MSATEPRIRWARVGAVGLALVAVLTVVWLWPNVEAILTWGAFYGLLALYLALIGWSQRRRRRGDEGSASNAEGTEGIVGFFRF